MLGKQLSSSKLKTPQTTSFYFPDMTIDETRQSKRREKNLVFGNKMPSIQKKVPVEIISQ